MPHFFISVTHALSSFLSPASVCRKLQHSPTGCNPSASALLAHLRLYTQCGPAHRLSLQVILFYQVDIILSHPAVNLNVSAASQKHFLRFNQFLFVFWQEPFIFSALYLYLSPLLFAFFRYTKKTELYPAIGKGGTFPNAVLKNKNAASRSWS